MKSRYSEFDEVYIHHPKYPDVRKFVSLREKVVYINTAAPQWAKTIRILKPDILDEEV